MSTNVKIDALREDLTFKGDLLLDKSFLVLPAEVPVTKELLKALSEWEFKEFVCESDSVPIRPAESPKPEETAEEPKTSVQKISETLDAYVKKTFGNADAEQFESTEKAKLASVEKIYAEYLNYITSVYTRYATHLEISQEDLSKTVNNLCVFIRENKRYVLRITQSAEAYRKNFLVIHSMRSAVLAIAVGLELKLTLSKLVELGTACILHEIGMLRLPAQNYMTDKPLSPAERSKIMTHPIIGYNIVKDMNFPVSVQLGVLEHHEKENGTGYPRRLSGEKISTYAKIISVACTYEAITATRDYKEAQSAFNAITELLKNENGQYNKAVIKALLYSLSLFPIGSYVYLQNGKIGLVTDANPTNPKNPLVQLLTETEEDGSPKTVQTDDAAFKIVRVLNKKEQDDIQQILRQARPQETKNTDFVSSYLNQKSGAAASDTQFESVDLDEFS